MENEAYRRDQLWKAAFDTYFEVYFDETLVDALINRWVKIDDVAKTAIAITASGSAVAGWTLWNNPGLKYIWASLAGFGVICAIAHNALGVTYRLRDYIDIKNRLVRLRIEVDTFRTRMAIDPEFPMQEFESDFLRFRERFSNDCFKRNDVLATFALRKKLTDELVAQLNASS